PDTGVREEPEEREGPRDEKEARPKKRRRFRGFKDHRGGLIMALGLSSLALGLAGPGVLCCRPFGLMPLVGLPLGIAAFVLGMRDLARIRAREMDPSGAGPTKVGWICGIIGTAVCALGLVLTAVGIILFRPDLGRPPGRP